MVNNSFHPHVWYPNSGDVFRRNIVFTEYRPIRVNKPWGKEIDFNLLYEPGHTNAIPAADLQRQSGSDTHSIEADALFVNPAAGDYRVKSNSPALALGFRNFPMDQFGVNSPRLKAIVRTPVMPTGPVALISKKSARKTARTIWRGATIRSLEGEEYSSIGVARNAPGVFLAEVPDDSEAKKGGLQVGDFILSVNDKPVGNVDEFLNAINAVPPTQPIQLEFVHQQIIRNLRVPAKTPPSTPPK
jgi:hypothetical protein